MTRSDNHTGRKLALGALIAGIVGYLTGILTAPKSGKETREDIADKAVDIKDSIEDQLIDVNEELKKLIKNSKTKTIALSAQAREEFNEAVIKAKDAQNKVATLVKGLKAGEAKDPELNKAIKQARQAAKNLNRYLKS